MKVLVAYFSRKEQNKTLADILQQELAARGHEVTVEAIVPARRVYGYANLSNNWLTLVMQCMPGVPSILFSCFVKRLRRYSQFEVNIEPLEHPDVSGFDRVVVGGPKWMHLSYPVARYLRQVRGLEGKKVAGFTVCCGPPLKNFEIYAYFLPFNDLVRRAGGEVNAQLLLSSGYTDVLLLPTVWFKMISSLVLRKPISDYSVNSEWGKAQIARFCDMVEREEVAAEELLFAG